MFDQLTGNEPVKALLRRMLTAGRVPGALLFTGEEGVGKRLFAMELARALNCRNPQGIEGCGVCPVCKRIGRFNLPQSEDSDDWKRIIWSDHGDVGMVVAPKRVLLVGQIRQIETEANFRPFEGRARVFLIDEAENLNEQSANALLKVLEETPSTSHIILITSRPAVLLPTIRSRCQNIRFAPLSVSDIEQYLVNNKLAAKNDAGLLARCANGSIGRALNGDLESYKDHRETMLQVLRSLALTGDRMKLLRVSEALNEARYKDEYEFRLELLETLIRDALILSVRASEDQIVNVDLLPELKTLSERVTGDKANAWISAIEELRDQLIVNINRKVATDSLFLTMAQNS